MVNQLRKTTHKKCVKVVRDVVAADFGQEVADKVRVQYGGSVKPENVAEYMACPDVDELLLVVHQRS
ncbi:MAG: triose-phosphate isomerase [Streptococcus sp.]